ncbi:HTH_48 domain-containing protein [Trichonephila clavipes]|nr:HTH_48 domain-containing protein [Trichonephila clavipes]GFV30815.1 HTH_48 domain-containing protein [Trichonephila clavipes]
MGVTQIKESFNRFKDGRTSAESEQCCSRPQTSGSAANVERVQNSVMADRRQTVREISEEIGETKHGITTVCQPPYYTDLAPYDFWLFPKLKTPLKGSRFESREEIMWNATTELNTIPKDFQRCFQQWKDRWAKCVQA